MAAKVFFLTIPALRDQDVQSMPNLISLVHGGTRSRLHHSFPCVTWPSQANMLTGKPPREHGVIANGFYWRDRHKVEMWTAWNEVIQKPQIWDVMKSVNPELTSAAWFPMLSKGCGADYVCMPAPIHKPDGSEDLWCYTKPQEFYGELLNEFGHFPLQHFWGPAANIKSSEWIAKSAVKAAEVFSPDFFYIYLPHLDYKAQKNGPDSEEARTSVKELDQLIGSLGSAIRSSYDREICWMVASEYVITPVDHVTYPNRVLRAAGLLNLVQQDDGEQIDFENTDAWALADHQFSHIYLKDTSDAAIERVTGLFENLEGIDRVLSGNRRRELQMDHPRSGDVIVISTENSWQAYYWWLDDAQAPRFSRTVDIHRKPGYDPVELHFDPSTKSIPLDATLVKGSHGGPVTSDRQKGVFLSSTSNLVTSDEVIDYELFDIVLNQLNP